MKSEKNRKNEMKIITEYKNEMYNKSLRLNTTEGVSNPFR